LRQKLEQEIQTARNDEEAARIAAEQAETERQRQEQDA
jgi:hypothetical protein